MITDFDQLAEHLRRRSRRVRVAVVCAYDAATVEAVSRAAALSVATFTLYGDASLTPATVSETVTLVHADSAGQAAAMAVAAVRCGEADVLMKGLVNTDTLLHAVLDKQSGLLESGQVLSHLAIAQVPGRDRLLFFSDAAVIPYPTLEQRVAMVRYAVRSCHGFGIACPKVALTHCSEKVNPRFADTLQDVEIKRMASEGAFGECVVDGPIDVGTACSPHCSLVKHIDSPICGDADALVFPNIEAGNTFYKTITIFARAHTASMLQGTTHPVVLTSRSDSELTKWHSLLAACALAGEQ